MSLSSFKKTEVKKQRADALTPPPKEVLSELLKVKHLSVEWLAGDGSDRCYYRLRSAELKKTFVLMQLSGSDAEALRTDGYDWVKIADILGQRDIAIPQYRIKIPDYAALIIDDYGDTMLESSILEALKNQNHQLIEKLYTQCFEIIAKLLVIPKEANAIWCKRAFDFEKYTWELKFFFNQYVNPVAKLHFNDDEQDAFIKESRELSSYLAQESKFFVHRDFHSRNVMVKNEELAIIDFQDARIGAAAYDLASLVFDNYIPFDLKTRLKLFDKGVSVISKTAGEAVADELRGHYKAVTLQRQLKAIGTYGFLTHNKKRGNYLPYVKPALETLEESVVFDKRWPFLSRDLVGRLKDSLIHEQD